MDQRRITTNSSEINYAVAERIAAATATVEIEEGKMAGETAAGREDRGGHSRARRPNIRMLAHLHEHPSKITRCG